MYPLFTTIDRYICIHKSMCKLQLTDIYIHISMCKLQLTDIYIHKSMCKPCYRRDDKKFFT